MWPKAARDAQTRIRGRRRFRSRPARWFIALLLWSVVPGLAQDQESTPPPQPPPRPQFFAGTVTQLDVQHITISRTLVGKAPEHRTFVINAKTKCNKSALKVKARVTVRYLHLPEGDVALEIQIHPAGRSSRPS